MVRLAWDRNMLDQGRHCQRAWAKLSESSLRGAKPAITEVPAMILAWLVMNRWP
jgi:hypothetical protein